MGSADSEQWTATTHAWTQEVDLDHLKAVREARATFARGGRRHQMLEVLAYADDEAEALGRKGRAVVEVSANGFVSISDDGRGTDTRRDAQGRTIRKPVMATMDLRFFEAVDPPLLPDGLPRRGISTVAALSSLLVHENRRREGAWAQEYRLGVPVSTLRVLPPSSRTGTTVAFRSDLEDPPGLNDDDLTAFEWLEIQYRPAG